MIKNYKFKIEKGLPRGASAKWGVTLFIAVVIMGILLFISFAVANIAVKSSLFASSGRDSQYAFYAADSGAECALYWDNQSTSKFDPIVSGSPISCAGADIRTLDPISGTSTKTSIGGGGTLTGPITVGINADNRDGDFYCSGTEELNNCYDHSLDLISWSGSNSEAVFEFPITGPHSGDTIISVTLTLNHTYHTDAISGLTIKGAAVDNAAPMASGGSANATAKFGALTGHTVNWPVSDFSVPKALTSPDLTAVLQEIINRPGWVSGNYAALVVSMSNQNYLTWGFDDSGNNPSTAGTLTFTYMTSGGSNPVSNFGFIMNDGSNQTSACAIVTVTKNPDGTTHIQSRGYNSCVANYPRRVERGVEMTY